MPWTAAQIQGGARGTTRQHVFIGESIMRRCVQAADPSRHRQFANLSAMIAGPERRAPCRCSVGEVHRLVCGRHCGAATPEYGVLVSQRGVGQTGNDMSTTTAACWAGATTEGGHAPHVPTS
jgi:hypothetical protein